MKGIRLIKYLFLLLLVGGAVNSYSQEISNNNLLIFKIYLQENKPQKSIELYASLNSKEFSKEELLAVGEAYYQASNFKEAANLFLHANGIDAKSGNMELARCYAMLNKPVFSVKYLENYLNLSNRVTISEIKTINAFSNISLSKEWIDLWKKDWFSNNDLLFNDALYEFRIGNIKEAEEKVNYLLKKRPSYHQAYQLLSNICIENGKTEDALAHINSAIELKPQIPHYWFDKSELLYELNKNKKALKAINEAIKIDSSELNFFLHRVKTLLKLDKGVLAREELENILAFAESFEVYRVAGETYFQNGNYLQTLKYYNKCLEMESLNPDLHIARGLVYYKTGAFEFAEKDFSMALDFYPTKGEIYFQRALVRVSLKDYEKACSDFNKAREFGFLNADEYLQRYCQH